MALSFSLLFSLLDLFYGVNEEKKMKDFVLSVPIIRAVQKMIVYQQKRADSIEFALYFFTFFPDE